jgi:hypothetical protein
VNQDQQNKEDHFQNRGAQRESCVFFKLLCFHRHGRLVCNLVGKTVEKGKKKKRILSLDLCQELKIKIKEDMCYIFIDRA